MPSLATHGPSCALSALPPIQGLGHFLCCPRGGVGVLNEIRSLVMRNRIIHGNIVIECEIFNSILFIKLTVIYHQLIHSNPPRNFMNVIKTILIMIINIMAERHSR